MQVMATLNQGATMTPPQQSYGGFDLAQLVTMAWISLLVMLALIGLAIVLQCRGKRANPFAVRTLRVLALFTFVGYVATWIAINAS